MTTPVTEMTGADLKSTLRRLGLSPGWFAEYMGVTMRTVVRWCDGEKVGTDVATAARTLVDAANEEVERIVNLALSSVDDAAAPGNVTVVLKTYRTDRAWQANGMRNLKRDWTIPTESSWHQVLTSRAAEWLRGDGYMVEVEYGEFS